MKREILPIVKFVHLRIVKEMNLCLKNVVSHEIDKLNYVPFSFGETYAHQEKLVFKPVKCKRS